MGFYTRGRHHGSKIAGHEGFQKTLVELADHGIDKNIANRARTYARMTEEELLELLMMLARQPDLGNSLFLAESKIAEFIKPLNKGALRSELEWMQETVRKKIEDDDPSAMTFFQGVEDYIKSRLR